MSVYGNFRNIARARLASPFAQVSVYRLDLLEEMDLTVPQTFSEVVELADALKAQGKYIAGPLIPMDATCLFFTLMANMGAPVPRDGGELGRNECKKVVTLAIHRINSVITMQIKK